MQDREARRRSREVAQKYSWINIALKELQRTKIRRPWWSTYQKMSTKLSIVRWLKSNGI